MTTPYSSDRLRSPLSVEPNAMYRLLYQRDHQYSARVKEFIETHDAFERYSDEDILGTRENTHKYVRILLQSGLINLRDLKKSPSKFFKLCEYACWIDGSVGATLFAGYLIFGGSLVYLGTERHEHLIPDVESYALPGCFAMTEVDHGSNLRMVQTTCHFDPVCSEFVVNTPSLGAVKWAIALCAWNARIATVLARLIMPDGEDKGIHAFLVPLRDGAGSALPGVTLVDCGHLVGLNGVGIGGVSFRNVRIPRENLLNRFSDVQADGRYVTDQLSKEERFRATVSPLTVERLVPFASAACKIALTIAIRFSQQRRQFGPSGGDEVPIFTYLTHQRRLLPGVAKTYALSLTAAQLHQELDGYVGSAFPLPFQILCSCYKAVSYEYAVDIVRKARECCSVHSFRHKNIIGRFMVDLNGFAHAAGDTIVLLQHAARNILKTTQPSGELPSREDIRSMSPCDLRWQEAMLHLRFQRLHKLAHEEVYHRVVAGEEPFGAWNEILPLVIRMARAWGELEIYRRFHAEVQIHRDHPNVATLEILCQLFGITVVAEDLGWFLGELSAWVPQDLSPSALDRIVTDLCKALAPIAAELVTAFGIPNRCLPPANLSGDLSQLFSLV